MYLHRRTQTYVHSVCLHMCEYKHLFHIYIVYFIYIYVNFTKGDTYLQPLHLDLAPDKLALGAKVEPVIKLKGERSDREQLIGHLVHHRNIY